MKIDSDLLERCVGTNHSPKPSHHRHEPLQIPFRRSPLRGAENGGLYMEDPVVLEQLTRCDAKRVQSLTSRQTIAKDMTGATHELYLKLINEGEEALEKGDQLIVDAELKHDAAQRKLEHAEKIKAEADAYFEKVIEKARLQSEQARSIKSAAVAYQEQLLNRVHQQAEEELAEAENSRKAAETYREEVIAEAEQQAKEIISLAHAVAEREGIEIKQRLVLEAQRTLAQLAMIKTASQAELEAQKLSTDAANLEAESKEAFLQAEAKLGQRFSVKAAEAVILSSLPFPEPTTSKRKWKESVRHCLRFYILGAWTKVVMAVRKPPYVRLEG